MTTTPLRERPTRRVGRLAGAAALIAALLTGGMTAAAPQPAAAVSDGANGEIRGFLWPGANPTLGHNWEGTYRMPDGSEGWCASWLSPEPIHANSYVDGGILAMRSGAPMDPTRLRELAYIISTGSDMVINRTGQVADEYAAAVAMIVHDWTSDNNAYPRTVVRNAFAAHTDPVGSGQDPRNVPALVDRLIADAQQFAGPWTLSLEADRTTGLVIGETVTLGGILATSSGTPISGKDITLQTTGATLPPGAITTDANGRYAVEATITAHQVTANAERFSPGATVQMKVPVGFSGAKPQNMVLVDKTTVTASTELSAVPATGTASILKVDADSGSDAPVPGAVLEIRDSAGALIRTITTTNTATSLGDLPLGTYTVTEVTAPDGFVLTREPVSFTLRQHGETVTVRVGNHRVPQVSTLATTEQYTGLSIRDTAVISGTVPAGVTIDFELYGPEEIAVCEAVIFRSLPIAVTGAGEVSMTDAFTPSEPGRYHWIETLRDADGTVLHRGQCGAAGETSTVISGPAVTTRADTGVPVPAVIRDTAVVTGVVLPETSLRFELFGPSDSAVCETPIFRSEPVAVPVSGEYTMSDSFTATTAGSYYWIEHLYGPDDELISSGQCGAAGETSRVHTPVGAVSIIKVDADAAEPVALPGAVFEIRSAATGEDTGALIGTITTSTEPVSLGDLPLGDYIAVEMSPPVGFVRDRTEHAFTIERDAQLVTLSITNTRVPGVRTTATPGSYLGGVLRDTAVVTGPVPPGATVVFEAFGPSETPVCENPVFTSAAVPVTGAGSFPMTDSFTPTVSGDYHWIETLRDAEGEVLHRGQCGAEEETSRVLDIPVVTTKATPQAVAGDPIRDTAIVTGEVLPGTRVVFDLFGPSAEAVCETPVFSSDAVAVTGPGEYPMTDSYTDTVAGRYHWVERLLGPDGTQLAFGTCGAPNETTVVVPRPTPTPTPPAPTAPPVTPTPPTGLATTGSEPFLLGGLALALLLSGAALRRRRSEVN